MKMALLLPLMQGFVQVVLAHEQEPVQDAIVIYVAVRAKQRADLCLNLFLGHIQVVNDNDFRKYQELVNCRL